MWGSTRQEVSYYSVCQSIKPHPWLVDCYLATMQYGKCCVLLDLPSVYNDRLLSKQQIKFAWLKCLLFFMLNQKQHCRILCTPILQNTYGSHSEVQNL